MVLLEADDAVVLACVVAAWLETRPSWMARGACVGQPPEWWFSTDHADRAAARRVCARCPVAAECLRYAVGQPDIVGGIWAGLSQAQRKRMRGTRMSVAPS